MVYTESGTSWNLNNQYLGPQSPLCQFAGSRPVADSCTVPQVVKILLCDRHLESCQWTTNVRKIPSRQCPSLREAYRLLIAAVPQVVSPVAEFYQASRVPPVDHRISKTTAIDSVQGCRKQAVG